MDLANNRGGILGAQKLIKDNNFSMDSLERSGLKDIREGNLIVLKPGLVIPKEPVK